MSQLSEFLKLNELSQREIAGYLDVKEPYISKVCNGYQELSKIKKKLLLELSKEHNWDATPLYSGSTTITAKASSGSSANVNIGNKSMDSESVAVLRKEIEMLRAQLADKDEQIQFLKSLITK